MPSNVSSHRPKHGMATWRAPRAVMPVRVAQPPTMASSLSWPSQESRRRGNRGGAYGGGGVLGREVSLEGMSSIIIYPWVLEAGLQGQGQVTVMRRSTFVSISWDMFLERSASIYMNRFIEMVDFSRPSS